MFESEKLGSYQNHEGTSNDAQLAANVKARGRVKVDGVSDFSNFTWLTSYSILLGAVYNHSRISGICVLAELGVLELA